MHADDAPSGLPPFGATPVPSSPDGSASEHVTAAPQYASAPAAQQFAAPEPQYEAQHTPIPAYAAPAAPAQPDAFPHNPTPTLTDSSLVSQYSAAFAQADSSVAGQYSEAAPQYSAQPAYASPAPQQQQQQQHGTPPPSYAPGNQPPPAPYAPSNGQPPLAPYAQGNGQPPPYAQGNVPYLAAFPGYPAAQPTASVLSIAAIVLASFAVIIGILSAGVPLVPATGAVVCASIGLRRGERLAKLGLILGIVATVFSLGLLAFNIISLL
jgi:hypothetical protein